MDKMRTFMIWARRNHFWCLSAATAMAGLVTWFLSWMTLSHQYDLSHHRIKQVQNDLNQIRLTENHPNQEFDSGMQQLISKRRDSVRNAWNRKWELLKDRLKWPRKVLGDEFFESVHDKLPIERVDKEDVDAIDFVLREQYRDFIKREVPSLAEIVGARWAVEELNMDGAVGVDRMRRVQPVRVAADDEDTVVDWFSENQRELLDNHFDWSHQRDNVPTSLQVLYAQEDLWVLAALLNIIRETNAGVTLMSQAAVKRIEHIRLGKQVMGPIVGIPATDSEDAGEGGMTRMSLMNSRGRGGFDMGAEMMPGGRFGHAGAGAGTGYIEDPADGRYVDRNYQPLSADDLRSAATADDAESAFLAIAKRMPINMRVSIDQRRIPELLVACANSVLTVEIRQLRFDADDGSASAGRSRSMPVRGPMARKPMHGGFGGGSGGGIFGGGSGGGIRGGFGDALGGRHRAGGRPRADGTIQEELTWDVPIEIYGIIYIYNPVDLEKLGYVVENGYSAESIEEMHARLDSVETAPSDTAPVEGPPVASGPEGDGGGPDAEVASTSEVEGQPDR